MLAGARGRYLPSAFGLRRDDPAFGIFTGLLEIHSGSAAPENSLDGVCARLDALLAPDEKQTFLLHALRLRQQLPGAGERLDALLDRVAARALPTASHDDWDADEVRRNREVQAIYLGEGLVYDARHQEEVR